MRKSEKPVVDGEYCAELPDCPNLERGDDIDDMCLRFEKVPHPVFDKATKEFRRRRCPACLAEVPHD